MTLELVKNGKKVGVTAVSHKVISNLLEAICEAAIEEKANLKLMQMCRKGEDGCEHSFVKTVKDNAKVDKALAEGEVQTSREQFGFGRDRRW